MGDPQSALDFLRPLSQSPQAPPELFLEIGQLYLAAGRIGPAAELAQEMNNRFSGQGWSELLEANIALREGLFSNAVQRLQSAIGKEAGNSRNTHWLLAEAQMLAGRSQDAAQTLDRAIETWPESTDLLASRALVALSLKRPDQAIEYGQSALRLSPGNIDAAQAAVRSMIQLRRFDPAREILDRLVAIRPENPMPYLLRAEVESAAGETGKALEQLDLARPLSMSAALADQIEAQRIRLEKEAGAENWEARFRFELATNDLPQAIEIVSEAAKTFGAIRSVKAANAAVLLYQGRTNEAIRSLDKLLRESPKLDPMVCIYLIQALIQTGRTNEGIQLAEQAITQHPERADIRETLAEAFMAVGDDQKALGTLEKALDIAPGDDHVHYKLAGALRTSGRLDDAIEILRKGRALEGTSYDLITLRLADYLTEAGRPGEALDLAMEAHRNDPENTGLAFYLAGLLWNAGETAEADAVQKRAALAQPNSLECILRSIRYFQTTGRPRLALEQCTEGVRKFPADSEIYKYKGTLELALGQINPAVESFLKAIRFDYENAKTYLDIARQLNIVGLRKDGLEVLKLSVRALPNSLDCRLALAQQYFELGQTPEAWEQIPIAKEIESGLAENTLLMAGGFALNCLQSFKEIPLDLEKILIGLQSVPPGRPNYRLSRLLAAKLYLQLGEAAHCIDLFQELIEQGMGDPDTALKLLEFQRSARQWTEAEKTMDFMRTRFAGDPGVTGAIAQTYIEHARALPAADENRATLLEQARKLIEAEEQAEGLQTSTAGFTGFRIQITELRDGVKAAIAEMQGLPPALKGDLTIRYLLIDLLKKDGRWENARDILLELLRETGDEAALYELTLNFSEFQVSLEMLEDTAKDHLEKLPAYSMKCAEIFWRSQNKECQNIARDIKEVMPNVLDADWLYLLGLSCRACIPEDPLNLEIFRKSLALDPYHKDAGRELIRILRLRPNTQDEIREISRKVRNFHPDAYPELPA
jgi:tetratricopeptide (TPR) repeat protein